MAKAKTAKPKEKQEEKPEEESEEESSEEEETEGTGSEDKGSEEEESEEEESDEEDFPWDEHNRLKREAAERSKKDREDKKSKAKSESELRSLAEEEAKRADEAEARIERIERERTVAKVAENVKFRDPDDAHRYLTDTEMSDERSAEQALRRLKKKKPHLFDEQRRSGADVDDDEGDEDERGTSRGSGEDFGLERLRKVKRKT